MSNDSQIVVFAGIADFTDTTQGLGLLYEKFRLKRVLRSTITSSKREKENIDKQLGSLDAEISTLRKTAESDLVTFFGLPEGVSSTLAKTGGTLTAAERSAADVTLLDKMKKEIAKVELKIKENLEGKITSTTIGTKYFTTDIYESLGLKKYIMGQTAPKITKSQAIATAEQDSSWLQNNPKPSLNNRDLIRMTGAKGINTPGSGEYIQNLKRQYNQNLQQWELSAIAYGTTQLLSQYSSSQTQPIETWYATNLKGKKTGELLNYLQTYTDPQTGKKPLLSIYDSLKSKAQTVFITYGSGKDVSRLAYSAIQFKGKNWFSPANFKLQVSGPPTDKNIIFDMSIRSEVESKIVNSLREALKDQKTEAARDLVDLITSKATSKKFERLAIAKKLDNELDDLFTDIQINILGTSSFPKQSIPLSRVTAIPRKSKGSAFASRVTPVRKILRETKPYEESMGDFITNDTLTALTKREMLRRMPIGPVGGEPKSTRVLTFRTGKFVDSVKVFRDIRNQQISYYYSPNYWIHERTSRNPRNLIQSSIGSVAYALFAKRFNIVKSDASK